MPCVRGACDDDRGHLLRMASRRARATHAPDTVDERLSGRHQLHEDVLIFQQRASAKSKPSTTCSMSPRYVMKASTHACSSSLRIGVVVGLAAVVG